MRAQYIREPRIYQAVTILLDAGINAEYHRSKDLRFEDDEIEIRRGDVRSYAIHITEDRVTLIRYQHQPIRISVVSDHQSVVSAARTAAQLIKMEDSGDF